MDAKINLNNSEWKLIVNALVIVLMIAAILSVLSTFTGVYQSDAKKIKKKLFEAGSYAKDTQYELFNADYDSDGHKDAFIVVFREGKPENTEDNTEDNAECPVDIWYYDGGTESVINYLKNENLSVSKEHMHMEELTGKIFFIYDEPYAVMWCSHAMGIRNGEIVDYFENIKGTFNNADGNNIEISTYPINAGYLDGMFYGRTVMPQYLYYDEASDAVVTYKAYAITRSEAERIQNVSAVLENIKNTYAQMERNYDISFARRNDMLHLMIKLYTDETESDIHYSAYDCEYYTYRIVNDSLGELLSQGEGFYDDIDEESENQVKISESEERDIRLNTLASLRDQYLSVTVENVIYSAIYENNDENSAKIRYYVLHDDYSVSVREENYSFIIENNECSVKSSSVTVYDTIRSAEDFEELFSYCPNFFEMGMTKNIINEGITQYIAPETAAERFFNLSGGRSGSVKDTDMSNKKTVIYTFADGSQTELEMYLTYDGVWLPYRNSSFEINDWYMSLTEEDFKNAVTIQDGTLDEWLYSKIMVLAEFPEYGVKIYANGSVEAIVVEYGQKRYLYRETGIMARAILPQFAMDDYDHDGIMEIAVSEYCGSGTGVSIEKLSIIDSVYEMYDTIYRLEDPQNDLNEAFEYELDGTNLKFGLKNTEEKLTYVFDAAQYVDDDVQVRGMGVGNTISFDFSEHGNIRIYAAIEVYRTILWGVYLPGAADYPNELMAYVKYNGNGIFELTNISLVNVP